MMHMLCNRCGMSATIVDTPVGRHAWGDHMSIHDDPKDFTVWTWTVLELPL